MALLTPADGAPTVTAASLEEWRDWLARNGTTSPPVWLVVHPKASTVPGVRWHEAIEHALAFGWVDSTALRREEGGCYLRFSRRDPRSRWGPRNRERAERLIAAGLMTAEGQALIDHAKAIGTWPGAPAPAGCGP